MHCLRIFMQICPAGGGWRKNNMIDDYIKNAKKNLRRKIEISIPMSILLLLDASFTSILIRWKKPILL